MVNLEFIRTKVIKHEDFISFGYEARVREIDKLAVEGKEHTLQDGNMMSFRFTK